MATTGIAVDSSISRRSSSSCWCTFTSSSTAVVDDHDEATLTALTDSLAAVQHDMRILAAQEESSMVMSSLNYRLEVPLMFHAHSMLVSPSVSSPEIVLLVTNTDNNNNSRQQRTHHRHRAFVLTKAVETTVGNSYVEEDTTATTKDDVTMVSSQQGMDDAIMCSASIIYNMALFYHLKHLRDQQRLGNVTEDVHKAEQLYLLCLQVIEPFGVAHAMNGLSSIDEHLRNVYLLLRLGSLNNLGSIVASLGHRQDACGCYAGLMELLNELEDDYRSSSTVLDSDFQTNMINETEWSAMTSNCLAILFHIFVDTKTALAA
jgi:hypothetical protein